MQYDFVQVDAFSCRPLYGNPAAVVLAADDIPGATMQKIAQEMNLSETVFLLRPSKAEEADYRVRIFTPLSELPFAGHPTVAAAHTVLSHYPNQAGAKLLRQECGIGIVPVAVEPQAVGGPLLRMTQGEPEYRDTDLGAEAVAALLGCSASDLISTPVQVVSTGAPWLIAQLSHVAALSTLQPDLAAIAKQCRALGAVGVTVFCPCEQAEGADIRVRTFAPGDGIAEDPVCGSGNGSVAAYIARHVNAETDRGHYIAEQGIEIGRDGIVHAAWEKEGPALRIMIAGQAVTFASGRLTI